MRSAPVMFLFALMFAGAAAWVAKQWVEGQSDLMKNAATVETVPVVVAAVDIPFSKKLESGDIKLVQWPRETLPEDTVPDLNLAVGKVSKRDLVKDEVIYNSRLVEHLAGSTLSALIEPGRRAVSVRVNDVVGVAGFVLPGNRVDVLASRQLPGGRESVTQTVLQNIKVLAVDQEASPNRDEPAVVRAVTLEMGPEDATRLVKATQEGTLQLTLRNPLDQQASLPEMAVTPTPEATVVPEPPAPPAPRVVKPRGIRIIDWDSRKEVACSGAAC